MKPYLLVSLVLILVFLLAAQGPVFPPIGGGAAQVLLPDGSAANPSIAFASTPGLGLYRLTSSSTGWAAPGSVLGGSLHAAGITALGYGVMNDTNAQPHGMNIRELGVYGFSNGVGQPVTAGLSYGGAATVLVGNGTAGDSSGTLTGTTLRGLSNITVRGTPSASFGLVGVNTGGDATHTGYIEWRKGDATRFGYIGNDTANVTMNLENSANFVVAGGVMQLTAQTTNPTCSTTADIGKVWFDNTTTTTAFKVCMNVAGTVSWVTK